MLMLMVMVEVRIVPVGVFQGFMLVPMGMGFVFFLGCFGMIVLVVVIVGMAMFMLEFFVDMAVFVILCQMQPNADAHQ